MIFHALTFARSRGRCWKPRPEVAVFNTSQGTWRTLIHWKTMLDRNYCIKTENICYISRYFLHYFVSSFHRCLAKAVSTAHVIHSRTLTSEKPSNSRAVNARLRNFQYAYTGTTVIELGFNDTLVGHFVSSPREREKRDRRDSKRDEREGQGRKRNRNESEETEEIKTSPPYPYLLQE